MLEALLKIRFQFQGIETDELSVLERNIKRIVDKAIKDYKEEYYILMSKYVT